MTTEIRAVCTSYVEARTALEKVGAEYLHPYQFTDRIYQPVNGDPFNYDDQFVRMREYQETHWDQLDVALSHKVRKGFHYRHFDPKEFNSIAEAESFLANRYTLDLTFSRSGREYLWQGIKVYLEDIETLPPSAELLGDANKIDQLIGLLPIERTMEHSVPRTVEIVSKT